MRRLLDDRTASPPVSPGANSLTQFVNHHVAVLVADCPSEVCGSILADMHEVTRILGEMEHGDPQASAQLLPLVYDELRKLAAQKMLQEAPGQTLQATALVHEAYLRLVDAEQIPHWNSRGHFFGAAAEAMRRILVENARRKQAHKRGGGKERLDVHFVDPEAPRLSDDVLALNDALEKLEQTDRVKADLVKLRCFAGLTMEQAAEALGISPATAHRYWNYARAWLHREIVGPAPDS